MTHGRGQIRDGSAVYDARAGSRDHGADAVKGKQRRGRGSPDDLRPCLPVTAAGR
jgi:hypothetical protein